MAFWLVYKLSLDAQLRCETEFRNENLRQLINQLKRRKFREN